MNTDFLVNDIVGHIEGHLSITDRTVETFTKIYDIIQPNRILEIGFNAGHSAFMTLNILPEVIYHSIDIGYHAYTKVNADKLKEIFKERFDYRISNSSNMSARNITKYDAIFIDGDHSVSGLTSDLRLASDAGIEYILIDDYSEDWFPAIVELTEHFLTKPEFGYHLVDIFHYDSRDGNNPVALLKKNDS